MSLCSCATIRCLLSDFFNFLQWIDINNSGAYLYIFLNPLVPGLLLMFIMFKLLLMFYLINTSIILYFVNYYFFYRISTSVLLYFVNYHLLLSNKYVYHLIFCHLSLIFHLINTSIIVYFVNIIITYFYRINTSIIL